MKKIICLFIALLIFTTGLSSAIAVQGAPEGSALTATNYQEVDNGVVQAAQIKQQINAEIKVLQDAKIRAVNAYAGIKKEASSTREIMVQKRARLQTCEADDPTDCAQIRTQARVASGDYLENIANMLIKHLEQVQIKVKLSEEISEVERIKIIDIIGQRKSRLESVKDEITRLKNGENSEISSRQEIVKKLRNEVKDAKTFLRKISFHVEARKLKELIAQQEIASDKLERTINEMENADTETLEELLSIMEEDLEEAKKYIVLAMENTDDDVLAVIKEETMRNYLNRARVEVKDSYITLHKMVRIIRGENMEIVGSEISTSPSTITDSAPELTNEGGSEISNNDDSDLNDDSEISNDDGTVNSE